MCQKRAGTKPRPHEDERTDGLLIAFMDIGDTQADIVISVQHGRASGKVICAFGKKEISDVENGRPNPGIHPKNPKKNVKGLERVRVGDSMVDLLNSAVVAVEIEDGEEDATGFLDTCETEKGPFAVELVEGVVVLAELVCDLALADVVAF
jgi:hypothetical protein